MPSLSLSPSRSCAISLRPSPTLEGLKFTDIEGGFPHSEILGSKLVRSSPRLIAAYHVLHRLLAPRHPPDTLIALDCSHYRCPPSLTRLGRRESGPPLSRESGRTRLFKDQLLLRTYPGTERSSLPTAGMHDLVQIFQVMSTNAQTIRPGIIRICFLFTMSWNPQIPSSARNA